VREAVGRGALGGQLLERLDTPLHEASQGLPGREPLSGVAEVQVGAVVHGRAVGMDVLPL